MFEQPIQSFRKRRPPKRKLVWVVVVAVAGIIGLGLLCVPKIRHAMRSKPVEQKPVDPMQAERDELVRRESERIQAEKYDEMQREIADLKRQLAAANTSAPPRSDAPAEQGDSATESYSPETNIRQLRSGIPFKADVIVEHGTLASKERVKSDSYTANYTLNVRLPAPAKTLDELQTSNPKLGKILPGLGEILSKGEVSKWYYTLYDLKTARLKQDATALNELLTKHNLFDCETILNLKSAGGRRAMLLQADMDVVADGSDGDRLATMPDGIVNSPNYQPFTSYGWAKKTPTANPIVAGWEKRVAAGEKEIADKATTAERKKWLRTRVAELKRGIADMKSRSFLIAEYDPFIVVPVNILAAHSDPFAPAIGDYALVIYGDKVLPAIVGDGGPSYKVGEASLRIAKELSSRATPNNRPVSDLKVTYLIFPGTKDADRGPPDYDAWRAKCEGLMKEMGGIGEGFELGSWKNLLAPPPLPVPTPVPPTGASPLPGPPQLPVTPQPPAPTAPVGPGIKPGPALPPANPGTPVAPATGAGQAGN